MTSRWTVRTMVAALAIGTALGGPGAARGQGRAGAAPAQGGAPADWLKAEGRSQEWVEATAGCRRLLAGLKTDDRLVKKYLANVERGCLLLRRTKRFDWKRRTAIDFLANTLTDLAAGKEPNLRYAGQGVGFPYWSDTVGQVEAIWVHVPPGYDPAKRSQLFMYYKCGGGIHNKNGKAAGGYRPTVEVANQTDTFHAWSSLDIQVKGRKGAHYELAEAPAALAREFSIDPGRVFLTGWSDGGFTALWLASRWPHLVAGIAPNCANWQYTNVNQVGLYNVPLLAVDGWTDGGYNTGQFVRWQALSNMGYDAAGLWGHHGHSYQPYEDVVEFKRILDWAKTKRRDLRPKRVRYATWNLSWHRALWFSIERMADPCLPAQIDATVKDGNVIDVQAWNVAAYKLDLGAAPVDPAKDVRVLTNGKPSYAGPFKKELPIAPAEPPVGARHLKDAAMPGGITAQLDASAYGLKRGGGLIVARRRWMWVRPTGLDDRAAALLAKWVPTYAKADTDVTEKDLAEHNLFVLGGPAVNKLAARIAGNLPVRFGRGKFTIGSRVYQEATECVAFIHPNPLNPRRYVILEAFNDAAAFVRNGFFGLAGVPGWHFRSGDCVVMGVPARQRKWGVPARAGSFRQHHWVFDSAWGAPDETPVGELETRFGLPQLLRLRADAIREVTGADVGMIGAATPSYLRWADDLPAGPVTAHDLSTRDMLPEYVVLGDVKGADLYDPSGGGGRRAGLLVRASASTVLADPRDPSYDAKTDLLLSQIKPERTYRVAMGHWGQSAYGAEYKKMPKLFCFGNEEEFLAGKHVSLGVRNRRQIPTSVTEAVIRYVAKRGKVAPRRACFDLTQYILDPEINEFGACDWFHLGVAGDWQAFAAKGPMRFRYTLNLGLRLVDGPATAPPRKDSKRFGEMSLAGTDRPGPIDFGSFGRKLPVKATVEVNDVPVLDGKGRCVLIRLANAGRQDLAGLAVLSPAAQMRNHPNVFTGGGKDFIGLLQSFRTPTRAAMLVLDPADQAGSMTAPGAGWNAGLMGVKKTFTVKAGTTGTVAVFFVGVDKPAKSADHAVLSAAVRAARAGLIKLVAGK